MQVADIHFYQQFIKNSREHSRKSVECCLAHKLEEDEEQQQATKAATKARFNKYSIFSNYRTI